MAIPFGTKWIARKKNMVAYATKHNIQVPKNLRMTPYCGSACRQLMKNIQRAKWGDQAANGKWSGALETLIKPQLTIGQQALAVAKTQNGVKEHPAGTNNGPQVRKYQSTTGAYKQPWCGSYVTWCFSQVGRKLSGFNTAYVPSWVDTARAGKSGLRVIARDQVRPGDVVTYDWGHDGVPDHIGIASSIVDAGGNFTAWEGNTSVGNDSNGGEVMERNRNVGNVSHFIRVS